MSYIIYCNFLINMVKYIVNGFIYHCTAYCIIFSIIHSVHHTFVYPFASLLKILQ